MEELSEPEIDERELRIDVYRGGVGVGWATTAWPPDSVVVITHLPTGLRAQCHTEKSQLQNKAKALEELREKIRERQRDQAGR